MSAYDIPRSFAPTGRRHEKRTIHRTLEHLPATLLAEQGALHQQLIDYALESTA